MEATAVRIGKSKNESIIVDGEVFIKSCLIGKWNFLVVCEFNEFGYEGESKDKVIGRIKVICSKHRDIHGANNGVESYNKDLEYCLNKYGRDHQGKTEIIKIKRGKH